MLWAYSPALPPEVLITRYASDQSKFIDVAGARAHVRDQGQSRLHSAGTDPRRGRLVAHMGGLGARTGTRKRG